jgi:cyanobactin cluster PatC/TenC/TruC protein
MSAADEPRATDRASRRPPATRKPKAAKAKASAPKTAPEPVEPGRPDVVGVSPTPAGTGGDAGRAPATSLRIPPAAPLETGLSDYGRWVRLFTEDPPEQPPAATYRRGRIWA